MAQQITDPREVYDLMGDGDPVALFVYDYNCQVDLPYEELAESCPGLKFAEFNLSEDMWIHQDYDIHPGQITFLMNGENVCDPVPPISQAIADAYAALFG